MIKYLSVMEDRKYETEELYYIFINIITLYLALFRNEYNRHNDWIT
jgi:hypothetical protein